MKPEYDSSYLPNPAFLNRSMRNFERDLDYHERAYNKLDNFLCSKSGQLLMKKNPRQFKKLEKQLDTMINQFERVANRLGDRLGYSPND